MIESVLSVSQFSPLVSQSGSSSQSVFSSVTIEKGEEEMSAVSEK
jgi:hypothetical protein